jgi:UDP-N-acetylenolpyruvoylglucosamine reductase
MSSGKLSLTAANHLCDIVNNPQSVTWRVSGIDLRQFSTIGIGGRAGAVVRPQSEEDIVAILKLCNDAGLTYCTKGNGSNTVYGDLDILLDMTSLNKVIDGSGNLVPIGDVEMGDGTLLLQSGALLGRSQSINLVSDNFVVPNLVHPHTLESLMFSYRNSLAGLAYKHSLSGIEDLADIPGTVGGATIMNVQAYQQFMGNIVDEVILISPKGKRVVIPKSGRFKNLRFGYRHSILQESGYQGHVLYAVKISLNPGKQKDIQDRMYEQAIERGRNHPKGLSVGSVFKLRGYDADKGGAIDFRADELIRQAKCDDYSVNGITVAKQYPVFLMNSGSATLTDFINAMQYIHDQVKSVTGISLKPEVKFLPYSLTPDLNST